MTAVRWRLSLRGAIGTRTADRRALESMCRQRRLFSRHHTLKESLRLDVARVAGPVVSGLLQQRGTSARARTVGLVAPSPGPREAGQRRWPRCPHQQQRQQRQQRQHRERIPGTTVRAIPQGELAVVAGREGAAQTSAQLPGVDPRRQGSSRSRSGDAARNVPREDFLPHEPTRRFSQA